MINNIADVKLGLVEYLPATFNKSELIETFKESLNFLKTNITLAKDVGELVVDDNISEYPLLKTLLTYNGIKGDKAVIAMMFILGLLNNLDDNSRDIEKELLNLPDVVVKNNILLSSAMLFKLVNDYYFINRYITELLNYVVDIYGNNKRDDKREIDMKNLNDNELSFLKLTKFLSEDDKFAKNFSSNYPEVIIELGSKDSEPFLDTIIKKIKGKGAINILSSGFKYNPIYQIGKMIIDSRVKKAKTLKERQDMLKFKIIEAQTLNEEGKIDNEKMKKAIAKYQEEIDKAEYEIIRILDRH